MRRSPPIPTVAAIDSLRHPEVRAKRASKDGNMHRLATILRGPRKERGHLRVNAIAFIPEMTVIVWRRWYDPMGFVPVGRLQHGSRLIPDA
jgi:hypothetical protein